MKRFLCLDLGNRRVGVAISDLLGMLARPLCVIDLAKEDKFIAVMRLIEEWEVARVVVGYPRLLNGTVGTQAGLAEEYVRELRARVAVEVILWDEEFSTAEAQEMMIAAGTRRKHRRETIDAAAAAVILQSYLDDPASGTD